MRERLTFHFELRTRSGNFRFFFFSSFLFVFSNCYKTRSCLDLKKQKERKEKKKKKKNGSYHFEFSTQNEKLVAHASAPRRTSVCDKLTKKNTLINIQSERFPRGTKIAVCEPTKNI